MDDLNGSDLQVQTHVAFAVVAWALDRPDAARAIYSALEPFADQLGASASGQAASLGSVSRYLGQMAALMGDWDRVETDFARAMRRNLETGARAEVAETRLRLGAGPSCAAASPAIVSARARCSKRLPEAPQSLGWSRSGDAVAAALAAFRGGRSPLTDRELEVAALVADGLTNKEVATRLHLSVRTAENHVLNVMNKLGLDNRAQVAAWFVRAGSTGERPTR